MCTMPTTGVPGPGLKGDGRSQSSASWTGWAGRARAEIPTLDPIGPVFPSLEHSFVPEELFRSLTSASSSLYSPECLQSLQTTKTSMGFRGCLQTPDQLWHYPSRRNEFRHLTDHPVSLTGAGRDVSFLCDIATGKVATKAMTGRSSSEGCEDQRGSHTSVPHLHQESLAADSLIPKEFHIVKNRGVLPLKYFDNKYTTLLEDHEKKLRMFPSLKPSGRLEVIQLTEMMDSMLEKAGVNELISVTGPSQLHNMMKLVKAEQNTYNIVFHELIRQVSVGCVERGQLLSKLRQKYVGLMERIPEQLKILCKKMMAQQLVNEQMSEELLYFKESVEKLASMLCEIQEHDLKVTKEAEKNQEELAAALQEEKMNAKLLEEYRELYELQRKRLEEQVLHLTQEKYVWRSAAYDLALKIIDRNPLTLVRRLDLSGKTLANILKHFIVLLASKDSGDLADLQEETEQFREILSHVAAEIEHSEKSSRGKLQFFCSSLNKHLQYFHSCDSSSVMDEKLLDEILQDIKSLINMLKEELQQYEGEAYLGKMESLRSAAKLQEHWTELGQAMLNRHQDLAGALPPQHVALAGLIQGAQELYHQHAVRISGNNGTTRSLTALVRSMEDWLFEVQNLNRGSDMDKADPWEFYRKIPVWLAQADAVMSRIGSSQFHEAERDDNLHFLVVPRELFQVIQRWVLSLNRELDKNFMHLNKQVTELHQKQTLWLVNWLKHKIADHLSRECPQQQEAGAEVDEEQRLLGACKLQHEAEELVAEMDRLSGSVVRSCREIVNAIVQNKKSEMDLETDFELEELNKIKTECCNWVRVCNFLLSEIKGTPVSLLDLKNLRKLFGSEELQLKINLEDTTISSTEEELKAEDAKSSMKSVTEEDSLEQQPGVGADYVTEDNEATADMIRYVGHDSNIHLKSLKSDVMLDRGREMNATKSPTPFSQKEFEAVAVLECLQAQLLETEIRAQNAEKRSESLEEQLEEALQRIKELEIEREKEEKVLLEAPHEEGQGQENQ